MDENIELATLYYYKKSSSYYIECSNAFHVIPRNFSKSLELLQLFWMGCRSFSTAHKTNAKWVSSNLSTVLDCRSEQMFRGKWQRRKCQVSRGCLEIFHSDTSKAPNRVELVTCDMKSVQDDRLCFDVFSFNRTYHFQVSWPTQKIANYIWSTFQDI